MWKIALLNFDTCRCLLNMITTSIKYLCFLKGVCCLYFYINYNYYPLECQVPKVISIYNWKVPFFFQFTIQISKIIDHEAFLNLFKKLFQHSKSSKIDYVSVYKQDQRIRKNLNCRFFGTLNLFQEIPFYRSHSGIQFNIMFTLSINVDTKCKNKSAHGLNSNHFKHEQ